MAADEIYFDVFRSTRQNFCQQNFTLDPFELRLNYRGNDERNFHFFLSDVITHKLSTHPSSTSSLFLTLLGINLLIQQKQRRKIM